MAGYDMNVFLATGADTDSSKYMNQIIEPVRLNLLLSYHYYQNIDIDELVETLGVPCSIFFDSGAFSADTQGVRIDIDDYIEYVHRYRHLDCLYANLDVIRNPKQTGINQRIMESNGLNPLPVFHLGSPFAYLREMVDKYDYLALGGLVGQPKQLVERFLHKCFSICKGKTSLHGFGLTGWKFLKQFPFKSVDSSSWTQAFRFGQVSIFDDQWGRWHKVDLRDRNKAYKYEDLIRSYGFSPNDLCIKSKYDRSVVGALSAMAWMKAERWLTQRKKKNEVMVRNMDIRPHSSTSPQDSVVRHTMKLWLAQGAASIWVDTMNVFRQVVYGNN